MAEPWEDYVLDAPEPGRARDLDETRRLLYIALFASKAKREPASLIGTLVNALAHHSAKIDPNESGPKLVALIVDGDVEAGDWVREQIATITGLLGDG